MPVGAAVWPVARDPAAADAEVENRVEFVEGASGVGGHDTDGGCRVCPAAEERVPRPTTGYQHPQTWRRDRQAVGGRLLRMAKLDGCHTLVRPKGDARETEPA